MERKLACASRTSAAIMFNALVISFATQCWIGISFFTTATDPRHFLLIGEGQMFMYQTSAV